MASRTATAAVVIGVLAVAGGATAFLRRGPARLVVDTGAASRQATFRSTVTASGEIVATRYADIGSSIMGKIVTLPVAEGDRVRAGQLLARIDPVQAQSGASSAIEQIRALESDERAAGELVRAATADLAAAEARARDADQQVALAVDLHQQGLIPTSEFETARASADGAAAQVNSARAAIDRASQAQTAAHRRIAQAQAQKLSADDTLSKTSILSPMAGIVTRLRVREGEMVVIGIQNQPGTTLMTISDLGAIDAEVKVAEADVLRLSVDQPATVTLEAVPGKSFAGRVHEIGASALPVTGTGAAAREFKVVVRLDASDSGLRPGLTCDAEIVTSERTNVLTVPLQSVVLRRVAGVERQGVFLLQGDRATFTPVTSGVIGGLDIEVSGVAQDATVIVGPYQALRDLQDGALVTAPPKKG